MRNGQLFLAHQFLFQRNINHGGEILRRGGGGIYPYLTISEKCFQHNQRAGVLEYCNARRYSTYSISPPRNFTFRPCLPIFTPEQRKRRGVIISRLNKYAWRARGSTGMPAGRSALGGCCYYIIVMCHRRRC